MEGNRNEAYSGEQVDRFQRIDVQIPGRKRCGAFLQLQPSGYAITVATDEEGNYICVRQFRQGIKEVTTEFPAGGIERKDGREYSAAGGEDSIEYSAGDGEEESAGDGSRAENVPAEDALEAAKARAS